MTLCTAKRFGKAKAIAPSPFYLVPTDERFSHGPYRACGAFFVGCAGRQENAACFFKFGTCCALSLPALSSPLPGRAAFLAAILRGSALDKNRRAIALAPNAAKNSATGEIDTKPAARQCGLLVEEGGAPETRQGASSDT